MNEFQSNAKSGDLVAIDVWLIVATRSLCEVSKVRIEEEIRVHYAEALARALGDGASESMASYRAIESLGCPRAARKRFKRTHLTRFDDAHLKHNFRSYVYVPFALAGLASLFGMYLYTYSFFGRGRVMPPLPLFVVSLAVFTASVALLIACLFTISKLFKCWKAPAYRAILNFDFVVQLLVLQMLLGSLAPFTDPTRSPWFSYSYFLEGIVALQLAGMAIRFRLLLKIVRMKPPIGDDTR